MTDRKYVEDKVIEATIPMYNIREEVLTPEELDKPVTVDRLGALSQELGENIFEDTGFLRGNGEHALGGYMMCRYPERAEDILSILNGDNQTFEYMHLDSAFSDLDEYWIPLWECFAEFVNYTVHTRHRFNVFAFSVEHHYNGTIDGKKASID